MAGILKFGSGSRPNDLTISILVVASSELCEKISPALHHAARGSECRIVVHQCEFISQVLRLKPNLAVDFIIFAVDGRLNYSVEEVEANIRSIDEHYIISGYLCLVFCNGLSQSFGVTHYRAKQLADKYCIQRFLTANILDPDNCLLLGKRLLNLLRGILEFECGFPVIDNPIRFDD